MVEIPDALVERLKARQVVLVAGLGCGELHGAPGWTAFAESLAARLSFSDVREAAAARIAAGRLGDAIALVRDLLPHPVLEEAIHQAFPGAGEIPEAIRRSAAFPWRIVVTTAFDDLWERALSSVAAASRGDEADPLPVLVASDDPAQIAPGPPPAPLLHLFGRTAQPDSLCLGPGDARLRLVSSPALVWLDHVRRRRSLVFVGFRPADPDLEWLGAWLASRPTFGVPHFLFLDVSGETDPDSAVATWALRTGFEVIPCAEGTAEALHRLGALAAAVVPEAAPSDADVDIGPWLARWAQDPAGSEPRAVLARVETALREDERWDRLVELHLRRLDLLDDKDEQLASLSEVARIFRDLLGAPERALTAEVAMLRLAPTDDELWARLRADARAGGAVGDLVARAAEVAAAAGNTPDGGRIWREIARIELEDLERPDEALAAYRRALAADPGQADLRDEQLQLLRALEHWDDLVIALRAASAEADDPARAVALMEEVAIIHETHLADVEGAISAFEAALAMDPAATGPTLALERLYEKEKRWADLAGLLEQRARHADPELSVALRRRRAEILADDLDALDLAAEALEELLREHPGPHDRSLLLLLERIYARAESHDDYLRTLHRQAELAPTASDRLALLRRIAHEGEARPDGLDHAAQALEQILRLEPRDPEAYLALERLYRAGNRHADLAATLARRLEVTETAESRRDLLVTLGGIYDRELDAPEKALATYTAAESAGDRRKEIYEAISRLSARLERWDDCAASLRKWAEIAPDDPRALSTLARIQARDGDFERAAATFLDAAAHETEPLEQADLLVGAATLLEEKLEKPAEAEEIYRRALDANPQHAKATERLATVYSDRGRWEEAEKLLDLVAGRLAASLDPADADRQVGIELRLAEARIALGQKDRAVDCLARAHDLRPQSLAVLRKFGDLRFDRGEWKEALALFESLERLHSAALLPTDLAELSLSVGRCHAELGETDEAQRAYEKAKAFDAPRARRAASEALAALHAARDDWNGWLAEAEQLAGIAAPEEKPALWEEIGDTAAKKVSNDERAEAAYRTALDADPKRRSVLHKLLDLYTRQRRWPQAIETLTAIAAAEDDPAVRARTLYTAALICRDELDKPGDAAGLLERALDESPELTVAFEDLEALHKGAEDWSSLAHCYGRLLNRLGPNGPVPLRVSLWTRLGDLANRRLRDRKVAVAAYEAAAALDPSDSQRHETIAHLYEVIGPETREQAIAAHQRLIARDPHRTDSYRALAKLYGDLGQVDKQWCVAAALYHLKKIDPGMEALFRRYRPPQVRPPKRRFTEETWQRALHPDQDRLLDALLALCGPFLAAPAAKPPSSVGLGRKQPIDPTKDRTALVQTVVAVAGTMNLPTPDLFLVDNEAVQTSLLNLQLKGRPKIALVLGPATQRRSSFDLVFDLGGHLAFLRPERYLKFAFGTPAAIELGVRAALAVAGVPAGAPPPTGELARLVSYLQGAIPAPVATQMTAAAGALTEARGEQIDVAKWLAAMDMSAARIAFLLTGDLGAASRVLMNEAVPTSPVSAQKRMADLVAFSISEDYFVCRQHLGLEVA